MKKAWGIAGWVLFGIAAVGLVLLALPKESTRDFRGYIEEIQAQPDGRLLVTIAEVASEDSRICLMVGPDTSLEDMEGKALDAGSLQAGRLIDADKAGGMAERSYYEAKWIRVYI